MESAAVRVVAPVLPPALNRAQFAVLPGPARVRLGVEVVMEHVRSNAGR
jgi:hypothetical protein